MAVRAGEGTDRVFTDKIDSAVKDMEKTVLPTSVCAKITTRHTGTGYAPYINFNSAHTQIFIYLFIHLRSHSLRLYSVE
jgi:hypothetical protein